MATFSTLATESPRENPEAAQGRLKTSYQPQLDGLRALAIAGILYEHFGFELPSLLRCGPLSVRFFFVLTGYFITLSLWRVKGQIADSAEGSSKPLFRYFLGRFLRIGPPFYLALFVGALLGIDEVRTNLLWLATFQANNYFAYLGYWPKAISHFWSLAVQEQFYLLWPIVVLTLPRRWFLPVMAAFIVFGLGFRLYCIATNTGQMMRWVTLLGCVDSFAAGALVAYLKESTLLDRMWRSRTLLFAMPLAAFGCFYLGRALMTLPEGNPWLALAESVDVVFLTWLLATALRGMNGPFAHILSWSPLVYLGKISYGVYVYHVFVIVTLSPLLLPLGLSETHNAVARLAILTSATVALSSLSWHYFEQPFLAWKTALARAPRPTPVRRNATVTPTTAVQA